MKKVVIGIVIGVAIALVVIYAPQFIIPVTETPETTGTHIYIDGKIVVGGDGQPIELTNNPTATNPTYAELLAFLETDQTDKFIYIIGPPKNAYICADFARDVHNNAEAAGIRAAWVGIDIEGEAEGHAINAFQTTDRGLLFIDCTGKGLWDESTSRSSWDRRAYVEVGQSYQVAYLDYYDHHHSKLKFLAFVVDPSDSQIRQSINLQSLGISLDEETWSILEEMGWVLVAYDPFNEEDRERVFQKYRERQEWLENHNIEEMLSEWTTEWITENEANVYSWEIEPGHTNPMWVRADAVQGSWFEPPIWSGVIEEQVLVIDEVPVVWHVDWKDTGWSEPFRVWSGNELVSRGIVEDIHIHW